MQEKIKEIPQMYTIDEIAKISNQPKTRVRKWVISGQLPHVKAGRNYLINYNVFIDFLENKI